MTHLVSFAALLAALLAGCSPDVAAGSAADARPEPALAPVALADTLRQPVRTASDVVPDSLPELPDGFVRLSTAAPEVAQEMRYVTAYNFVGEPIDGYERGECILTTEAAEALKAVAADLARQGLGLKVYDCYRPQRAVDHFARWARGGDETMKEAFYPEEPKGSLFRRGYIAARSGHSRGSTVDLTLVRQPAAEAVLPASAYPDPSDGPLPRCDRPLSTSTGPDLPGGGRLAERDLDMGTAYDCLSPVAATASTAVSAAARRNRQTLKAAMERRGFRNYAKEWWHFTLRGEPFPNTYHTFPVQ